MPFQVGDKVKWSSQAGGSVREKIGTVVEGVRMLERVTVSGDAVQIGVYTPGFPRVSIFGHAPQFDGGVRKQHSYIVLVPRGPKAKPALYWPLVSKLKLVEEFHAETVQA